jgi:Na+/H+ antiporter NhaD/arsenite permease-like protein
MNHLDLPAWSVVPFALLLLTIAFLPLVASHWWHSNLNRALVAAAFALPVVAYLVYVQLTTGQDAVHALLHELENYVAFLALLGALYTVSGGIVLAGDFEGRPLTNTAFLAVGAVLADLIGTTGASVLLIRPVLRINKRRQFTRHLPIFFIFVVSNLGGLLTPLGDPPLFLGFLNGVPFYWTLFLWPQWLMVNGIVLTIFLVWETVAFRREPAHLEGLEPPVTESFHLKGWINFPLLAGVLVGVFVQAAVPGTAGSLLGALIMLAMAGLSLWLTPRPLRDANGFTWGPIMEVAILFLGIFITMVPALEILAARGQEFNITEPWQFFWLTGGLSGFLDNAPTYLTFATLAAGSDDFSALARGEVAGLDGIRVLQAISCGAVFMGAMTYIGNGPNFMVKAIADEGGFKTPSFFGYLAYSAVILLPVFVVVTLVFF